jgi:hypothetical protein
VVDIKKKTAATTTARIMKSVASSLEGKTQSFENNPFLRT